MPWWKGHQDDHFETDPLANMPRGLVHVAGSERRVLSHPGSPHNRWFLRFADWNPHTLPHRLSHSGPVAGGFNIAQDPPPQLLRLPGAQGQLAKSILTPASEFHSWEQLSTQCRWQQISQRSEQRQFSATRLPSRKGPPVRSKLSRECWALWQRLRRYFRWVYPVLLVWTYPVLAEAEVPSTAWRHGCHRVMVTRACVSALACWRDLFWLKQGVTLDTAHRRKVVTTDASNKGWGALCEGKSSRWRTTFLCGLRTICAH